MLVTELNHINLWLLMTVHAQGIIQRTSVLSLIVGLLFGVEQQWIVHSQTMNSSYFQP